MWESEILQIAGAKWFQGVKGCCGRQLSDSSLYGRLQTIFYFCFEWSSPRRFYFYGLVVVIIITPSRQFFFLTNYTYLQSLLQLWFSRVMMLLAPRFPLLVLPVFLLVLLLHLFYSSQKLLYQFCTAPPFVIDPPTTMQSLL